MHNPSGIIWIYADTQTSCGICSGLVPSMSPELLIFADVKDYVRILACFFLLAHLDIMALCI